MEVSPDGASIAFSTYRDGTQNIWVMTAKGDNPKRLTQEDGSSFGPSWTADGKALIYQFQKRASVVQSIRRLALPDLATSLLVEDAPSTTVISPDGKSAAYVDKDNGIVIASIAGEHPIKALLDVAGTKTFSVGPTCGTVGLLSWSSDGQSMLFRGIKAGVANVWSQSLAGGPPKELTSFNVDHIYSFDVSRDGKKLACVRGTETNDAVVIRTSK